MNIGNPSPQEIFDSYSQIPNTPQGKQMLTNLVQAFKNSGDMRGSIATSILNSYNSQQPPAPPPPQGQVADHVVAQAQPHPDFMGIGAPGLDLAAPPGMATGGLVAFAQGGPVRGFSSGHGINIGQAPDWQGAGRADPVDWDAPGWTLNDLFSNTDSTPDDELAAEEEYYRTTTPSPSKRRELEARRAAMTPATTPATTTGGGPINTNMTDSLYRSILQNTAPQVQDEMPDYYSRTQSSAAPADTTTTSPEGFETPAPVTPTTRRSVGAGESSHASMDEKVQSMMDTYGVPPDIASELISKHEHDQAKREKFNAFENIAAALGGYLSAYGPGQHRAGAGIAAMLGQMGQHDKEAREDSNYMDALRMKAAMQPYETHKSMVDQVLAAEAANRKAREEAAIKMWEARYGRETKLMEGKQGGEYGLRREGMQGQTSRDVAGINK